MKYIWKSSTNSFVEMRGETTDKTYTQQEVEEMFAKCEYGQHIVDVNGQPTIITLKEEIEKEIKMNRMFELKTSLDKTDYKAIQKAEGVISAEEYEPIRIQREEWRQEIRKIEAELGL